MHLHALANFPQGMTAYFEFYKRTAGGTETLLGTSHDSDTLTTSDAQYELHANITTEVAWVSGDRVVVKVYGRNTNAANKDISLHVEGDTLSRTEFPAFIPPAAAGFTGTAGSIPYVDAGGTLTENNLNLFWSVGRTQLEPNLIKITSDGTQAAPALKFNDTNTGFYKSGDSVRFSLNNSTKYTVDGTGVGIGTTSPSHKLHVKSTGTSTKPIVVEASDGTEIIQISESSGGAGFIDLNNAAGTNTVQIFTAGASFFNGGDLGVGTNNPSAKLHIKDNGGPSPMLLLDADDSGPWAVEFRRADLTGSNDDRMRMLLQGGTNGFLFRYRNQGGPTDYSARLSEIGVWENAASFANIKKDRSILSEAETLDILNNTNIETFRAIGTDNRLKTIGIVVDEAHEALVSKDEDEEIIGYSPMHTASVAFRGVQILMKQVKELKAEIELLKKR